MMMLLLGSAWAATLTAFVGATVHPVSGPPLEDATLLINAEGQIEAVYADRSRPLPAGTEVIDVSGKHIIPGLVDTHSHIGGGRLHESLSPIQPGISAIDAIDPTHPSVARARAGGVTTANIMPGSGKLMGGQTAYLKLRPTSVVDDMLLCTEADPKRTPVRRHAICGGMKMANGTNPQGSGGDPKSRMGAAFLQRKALLDGVDLAEKLAEWEQAEEEGWSKRKRKRLGVRKPTPEPHERAIAQLLNGTRTIHFHTHRVDDIVTVLRLQEEFGLRVVLQHVSEGWKVAPMLGERQSMVSLILVDSPGGKEEALELFPSNAAALEEAGALVALHTDDPITDSRLFLRMAGLAVRGGMSPSGALASLTLAPATMLGLENRIGSLDSGKDADFVILSGPPLSVWTHIEQTYIDGVVVFDRDRPEHQALAIGGDALISHTEAERP